MAKIPQYFAQERIGVSQLPTPSAPRAPARELADVGAGLVPEAKAGFGRALTGVSDILTKWYEREGNSQFDTQRRLTRELINKFELTNFPDADSHDAAYKKMRAEVKKLVPKNKMGARKFQSWLDSQSPVWDRSSDEKKIRTIRRNSQVAYFRNIAAAKTEAELKLLTQGAIDDNIRTPEQVISDMAEKAISVVHAAIEAASDPDTGTGNFVLAKELAKNPLIPEPRQTTLRNAINSAEKAFENKQKTLTDIYVEQAHKSAVTELVKDVDNVTFIKNMPEELQEFWQEKLDKRTVALEKERDIFNEYDPVLYSGLKQQIRETPDKVNYMDIVRSVGKGLTPVMAQELFELQDEMQRKDSPLAQSHIKRAHDRINDLQGAGLTVKGIAPPTAKSTPEEAIGYMNVFDEMHEAIDRNVDLKPAEMRKFTEEMVRPIAEEAGKGFWGILRESLGRQPTMYGFALGSAYMERERLLRTRPTSRSDFEMKFKRLYSVDPDTANKYWDRWDSEL